MKARHLFIAGRVHGVGFREWLLPEIAYSVEHPPAVAAAATAG